MKPVNLKNKLNGELFVCNDPKQTDSIDGIEYLLVHRPGNDRQFLMRKDVLEKIADIKKIKASNKTA